MKAIRLGIAGKLAGAMALIAAVPICASGIALIGFERTSGAIGHMTGEGLPQIRASLEAARWAEGVIAAAPALAQARTREARESAQQRVERALKGLDAALTDLRNAGASAAQVSTLAGSAGAIRQATQAMDSGIETLIELESVVEQRVADARRIEDNITKMMDPLKLRWNGAIEQSRQTLSNREMRERHPAAIKNLVAALAARAPLEAFGQHMQSLSRLVDDAMMATADKLDIVKLRFGNELKALGEVLDAADPRFKTAMDPLLAEFSSAVLSPTGLVELQRRRLQTVETVGASIKQLDGAAAELNAVTDRVLGAANDGIGGSIGQVESTVDSARGIVLAAALASILVVVLIARLYVGRNISGRITRLGAAMRALAEGKLDEQVDAAGTDEVGEMARTLRTFRDSLASIARLRSENEQTKEKAEEARRKAMRDLADRFEATVGSALRVVTEAVEQLRGAAQGLTATAERTTQQTSSVAAASEQASTNVQTVASASEELTASIGEIGRQVTHSAQMASKAVEAAQQTNATVEGLAEAANKIGAVVQLITDIASQTNLLALNATIEAARAGEAGKGFAVVASEVKSLANQTAKATEEIAMQVSSVQTVTADTVTAIRTIGQTIADINAISTTIAAAVEEQGAATREITRNTQQAAKGTQDVSATIVEVSKGAGETGNAAGLVLEAAGALGDQAEALRAAIENFLGEVRAA